MEDALISILESFGYPVMRQGSLAPSAAYPATFITFWNNDETGKSFYDNITAAVIYSYGVNVYSNSPDTTYSVLRAVRTALISSGWIIPDRGHDAYSDEITHTGRGLTAVYLDYEINNEEV